MTSVVCPEAQNLERLARGHLPDADAAQLEQHVLGCSRCAQFLLSIEAADPPATVLRAFGQLFPAVPRADTLDERPLGASHAGTDEAAASASLNDTPGPPTHPELLPQRLGRYQVLGRLGAGGMGVVLRAHDPQLGRDVAVKVPNFRGSEEARAADRQRFLREARAAAAVRHANVCPVYDVGEEQGRPYAVMAFVEGQTLDSLLRRQGRFEDLREAVALLLPVADALAAVHAAGVVHRDLKPANILLDRAGQPFLADFGLARGGDDERLTGSGQLMGTPAYMAPEQASPELGPVGPLSDQYSLAVVLYQMLTGRLPFEGPVASLIYQVGARTVPPPSQHRAGLDADLERVLLKALARSPADRYASVADFAGALRAWRGGPTTPTPRPGREAQWRRLSVLQCGCDVFDSPAILAALDPEEQHDLLLEFQQLCRNVAAGFDGTVVKATNHGLLICFGYPAAQEQAAHRAVRAGLHLLGQMAALNEGLGRLHPGMHLAARVAVHSDRAIVTANGGPGEALGIVGSVLPVADQLEHLAAPDTVVISDDSHQLVRGHFECTGLDAQPLAGAARARRLYRVHRELGADSRVEVTGPPGLTPLIGRAQEVALLQDRWERAAEGMGQVVLLAGEPGIGKSRLVHVLKQHVDEHSTGAPPAKRIEWPCTPHTKVDTFHAIRHFEEILGLDPHDDSSRKLDKLAAHLEDLHLASPEAISLLAALLLIPLDGRYPPLGLSPQRQKEKTFDLQLDWLRAQARRQPVLFVVEDLHWAGPTFREFLDFLVGQIQGDRILVLCTCRPEFQPPWRAQAHHTQVSLNRLTRRQVGALMAAKTRLAEVPPGVLDLVAARTDGVPLFVEEFTAMLLEAGGLRVTDGAARLSDTFDVRAIPATLQDLLLARLDRIAGDLEVVQLAAVIGREFSYEMLAAVATCGDEALRQELAKLVEAELLFQYGRAPAARYQFKHALIQDAAYQSLLKKRRQEFHVRVAETLEHRFPETCAPQPELLAYHFAEGNLPAKAARYLERAGESALLRSALGEALGHFTRGLELVRTLPETPERHRQEIELHVGLGLALSKGYSAPEVEAHYAQAHALCEQTGLTAKLFPVLVGRWRMAMQQAKYGRAYDLAQELLRLADREANIGFRVAAHRALGATLLYRGEHVEAVRRLEEVLAVPATADLGCAFHRCEITDPWISARSLLSWPLWLTGRSERATDQVGQALTTAAGLDRHISLAHALCYASCLHQFDQDRNGARATAARAHALASEKGFQFWGGWAKMLCGWALAEPGRSENAVREIRQALADWREQGSELGRSYFLSLLAEACARAGRSEEGLQASVDAQEFADATGERFWQPEIHRLKGELLLQHDPATPHEAEACFFQALEVARRQQARALELRAAMSLARLWCRQGKTQPACTLVEEVYRGFTEGFQTHDLQTAAAFLGSHQT